MRVIGKTTQWEGRFLRASLLKYEDREGKIREWEIIERTASDGVVIIAAITADSKLLLIRQYRPALDCHIIELPAGLMDVGESPLESCKRELIEETGYASDDVSTLSDGVISTGILAENWHAMLALDARPATAAELSAYPPDETEDIEVVALDLESSMEELSSMEQRGERVDIRIYGMVELARRRMRTR